MTWAPVPDGPYQEFRHVATDVCVGGAGPEAGWAYAAVTDYQGGAAWIWASPDGLTWERRASHQVCVNTACVTDLKLAYSAGGPLIAGSVEPNIEGASGRLFVSDDGGRTLVESSAEYPASEPYSAAEKIRLGPDGRAYAVALAGVYRTASPLPIATGQKPAPQGPSRLGAPFPNPAMGEVTVPVTLGEPGPARVELLDAAGRLVRVLYDGSLPAGTRAVSTGPGLPAGTYVVRLVLTGGKEDGAKITIAR